MSPDNLQLSSLYLHILQSSYVVLSICFSFPTNIFFLLSLLSNFAFLIYLLGILPYLEDAVELFPLGFDFFNDRKCKDI